MIRRPGHYAPCPLATTLLRIEWRCSSVRRFPCDVLFGFIKDNNSNPCLVHSTPEYCFPVWCHSAHTRLIDPAINDALRILTGCLRPTPVDNFPILASIQPAELRCKELHSLACRATEPGHHLHSALTFPLGANARRLKSRRPFILAAEQPIFSFHLTTTTYVRRTGRITNGRRSDWTTFRDTVLSSPTPVPTLCLEKCAPCMCSVPSKIYLLLCRLWFYNCLRSRLP